MIKNLLFICLTFFKCYAFAQGFVASYGFADVTTGSGTVDPGAAPVISGVTFGSFSATGTSANPSASGRFSFTNWPLGGINASDDYSNFTGALSPTVYYEVTIQVHAGYTLSLNSASFTVRRSGTGIRQYCIRSSLDNYINNLAVSTGTNTKLSVIPGDVFFWNYDSVSTASDQKGSQVNFGTQFGALGNSVTFRIYAWNAESTGGSFGIDNFSFVGSVMDTIGNTSAIAVPIPELAPALKMYPNPSPDGYIHLENAPGLCRIEISSLTGNLLLYRELKDARNFSLDLSDFDRGLYFLKICTPNAISLNKIVLAHK